MQKINIGLIGAGMFGEVHIKSILKNKKTNLSCIASVTEETLNAKMKKYKLKNGTTDYKEILNDKNIDAVVIATPPYNHSQLMIEALRKGKHVLVEKPLCINESEMEKILNEVNKHKNLVAMECSARHTRLQPKFRFIKKMIDDGKIGDVYYIHHNHLMSLTFIEYNKHGSWALDKKTAGGGPIIDWGAYDLSFHLGLLNDKPELKKMISFKKAGLKKYLDAKIKSNIEEHAAAFMKFNNNLDYYYERGSGVHSKIMNESRIFGTKGSLRFSYYTWDKEYVEYYYVDKNGKDKKKMLKVKSKGHDDNYQIIDHFADCIAKGTKPVLDINLACKHIKILFEILK